MKPITFEEADNVIAKEQKEYLPLPAHISDSKEGIVTTCWELTLKEAINLLFTRKLWHCQMAFHKPLQPIFLTVNKKEALKDK